tara:strand:- start:6218 stop:6868 length:651 start_codon:yes stop_codon:yes gene_type:complete
MPTTNAHSSVTVKVNDGGTVVKAGNVTSDSAVTKVIGVNELNTGTDYGSKVVAKANSDADKAGVQAANSGGAGGLAYFPTAEERNFLLRGAGDTSGKINNSTDDAISSPASEVALRQVNDVHSVVKATQVGRYSDTEFNVLATPAGLGTGRTRGTSAGAASNYQQVTSAGTAATDDAASPTRGVPGELTFMFGAKNPTNATDSTDVDYKARDSFEA